MIARRKMNLDEKELSLVLKRNAFVSLHYTAVPCSFHHTYAGNNSEKVSPKQRPDRTPYTQVSKKLD